MATATDIDLNEQVAVDLPLPFMERFDPTLVPLPAGSTPGKNHRLNVDPIWKVFGNTFQFVDSYNDNEQTIAVWDVNFNLAYFFGNGFLHKNPNMEGQFKFTFDPHELPFDTKEKEGMNLNNTK